MMLSQKKKDTGGAFKTKVVFHIRMLNVFCVYFNTALQLDDLYFEENNASFWVDIAVINVRMGIGK